MKKLTLKDSSLMEHANILQAIESNLATAPNKVAFKYFEDGETERDSVSYATFVSKSKAVAAFLQREFNAGDRLVLMYPQGLDFIYAFVGCLYAGIVPVPMPAVLSPRFATKIKNVVTDCSPKGVLSISDYSSRLESNLKAVEVNLPVIGTNQVPEAASETYKVHNPKPNDIAFLQYTSGSTGNPKGVIITHRNVLANVCMFQTAMDFSADKTQMVSWLPQFHDMGLVGCTLGPILVGFPCATFSPTSFLERPSRWLELISKQKATVSGAPNFAFQLCLDKMKDEEISNLNLSSLTVLFNGAEPIRFATMEAFAKRMSSAKLNSKSLFPCYGMAEATLFVSGGPAGCGLDSQQHKGKQVVDCGSTFEPGDVVILSQNTDTQLAAEEVGEIAISGPHVSPGYWSRSSEVQNLNVGHNTHRTGDLGYVSGNQIFVTGRIKDLIIVNGTNHYPQDLEDLIEAEVKVIKRGSVVATTIPSSDKDLIAIVAEVRREERNNTGLSKFAEQISSIIFKGCQLAVHEIVFVAPGNIPKTSSGKLQRSLTGQLVAKGKIEIVSRHSLRHTPQVDLATPRVAAKQATQGSSNGLRAEIEKTILTCLTKELDGNLPDGFSSSMKVSQLGLESVSVIELRTNLEEKFSTKIPNDFFLDDPTVEDLILVTLGSNKMSKAS